MKVFFRLLCYVLLSVFLLPSLLIAQIDNSKAYFDIDERKVVETKWKYAYALHLESNTIIHQAEDTYEYFLYFRYNYTYEQYLNGKFTRGTWKMAEDTLFYRFKHIKQFRIAAINKQVLVLEFTQDNSRGTYQYHFISVPSEKAPFVKPANELPLVKVEIDNPQEAKKRWWSFAKRKKRKKKKKREKAPEESLTYISDSSENYKTNKMAYSSQKKRSLGQS